MMFVCWLHLWSTCTLSACLYFQKLYGRLYYDIHCTINDNGNNIIIIFFNDILVINKVYTFIKVVSDLKNFAYTGCKITAQLL